MRLVQAGAHFAGRLCWQRDYSLWRVKDVLKRTRWGQWRTEAWLGHVYVCWLWPFGFERHTASKAESTDR